jgi:hypothetical protein
VLVRRNCDGLVDTVHDQERRVLSVYRDRPAGRDVVPIDQHRLSRSFQRHRDLVAGVIDL